MKALISALLLAASGLAVAGGDPVAGEAKAKAAGCFACHGQAGNSTIAGNPILAGQYADYIEHALKSYKNGTRKNATMQGMASTLSKQDIKNLAAYFSAQKSDLISKH